MVSSDLEVVNDTMIDDTEETVLDPPVLEKPRNFQTVSLDDIDDDEEPQEMDDQIEDLEDNIEEETPTEEAPVAVANLNDSEESDLGELFAEKIEVRPQVRQLLDKYGTISVQQLKQELEEVAQLLARK